MLREMFPCCREPSHRINRMALSRPSSMLYAVGDGHALDDEQRETSIYPVLRLAIQCIIDRILIWTSEINPPQINNKEDLCREMRQSRDGSESLRCSTT